jgi:hypothetical protein
MESSHPAGCVHHWIFESPNGHTSIGKCRYCGKQTESVNCFDSPLFVLQSDHQKFRDQRGRVNDKEIEGGIG